MIHVLVWVDCYIFSFLFIYFLRCYALAIIKDDSEEFQEASIKFEKLTSDILENALNLDDKSEDKRLVKTLHEACGFEQVGIQTVAKLITIGNWFSLNIFYCQI